MESLAIILPSQSSVAKAMEAISMHENTESTMEALPKFSSNLAAWLHGVDDLRLLPYETPLSLGPQDVRVKVKAVGICGSDVHYLKHMRIADFVVKEPMVIGHECAGLVAEVGGEVCHLAVGDRVALEPGIACGRCRVCKEGKYNLCGSMRFFATPPVHGALANEVVHPADLAFKIPEELSMEEGALCEPLSVAIHACRRGGVGPGSCVAVMGAGVIGIVTMLAARALGAAYIGMTDVSESRLERAKEMGADFCLLVTGDEKSLEAEVTVFQTAMQSRGFDGCDVTIDCVGLSRTMEMALGVARPGSRVVLVGMAAQTMTLPLATVATREIDIVGSFRYRNTYPLALELLRKGKIDLKHLVTHRFGFTIDDINAGFEVSAKGGSCLKAMFVLP